MSTVSIEDLLTPRIKCIAPYPDCEFKVGQIIQFPNKSDFYTGKKEWESEWIITNHGESIRFCINKIDPEKYPANFKRLEWWEEKKPEEMPEYVKYNEWNLYLLKDVNISTVKPELCIVWDEHEGVIFEHNLTALTPVSKEEYESFINSQKQS